ncbi:hypothetical protein CAUPRSCDRAFT_12807 [Caulochytrium protostelioides]|uniref:Uncharacterized protein n=1 Tax=Caulochytrium protostelioides TaxID=1555241 RepID=A0A4P9WQQ0_9FUNG|nr:hypothetical protein CAUPRSCDRAFT_12807 [Caulochytrium protostelioides]
MHALKRYAEHEEEWDTFLPAALWACRTKTSSSTGFSPFELLYGRLHNSPFFIPRPVTHADILDVSKDERDLYAHIMTHIRRAKWLDMASRNESVQRRLKLERYNVRLRRQRSYQVGQLVKVRVNDHAKLMPSFQGPFRIKALSKYNTAVLEQLNGVRIPREIHLSRLEAYQK